MDDTAAFEWKGGKITVQRPNGFSKQRVWRFLHTLSRLDDLKGYEYADIAGMCYYLANITNVEGSIGFPVPFKNPTPDEILSFAINLGKADEDLIQIWDNILYGLKVAATNDPDLLPPDVLDESKKTTTA